MRIYSLVFIGLAPLSTLAQGSINITETNEVNLANGTGNLGWGATNLPFGYSAGVGFNFAESTFVFFFFFFFSSSSLKLNAVFIQTKPFCHLLIHCGRLPGN